MKQRFSSLDIKVIAHELSKSLVTLRVSNIYDLSSRIFLFKFAKPDHREQLIIDSGFRCHLTSFSRTTAATPTDFVARLRKFLKTRRVTSVAQIGTDRVLELQFSDGQYRLFFEFYAGGNIVLVDRELKILTLLRSVNEGAEWEQVKLGGTYSLSERQNVDGVPEVNRERIQRGLEKFLEKQESAVGAQKKGRKKGGDTLRKALASTVTEFPPMLLEHALRAKRFDTTTRPEDVLGNDELMTQLMDVLGEATSVVDDIMARDTVKGYIVAKRKEPTKSPSGEVRVEVDGEKPNAEQSGNLLYDDYHPFKPSQATDDPTLSILEFDNFNKAVDDFYSSIEGQKLESRLQEKEENARKKLEHAKNEQEKRLGGLQQVQELNIRKAQAIEANLARVEETSAAINGLIAQGMDWIEIDRLIELEQARHNPVAEIIKLPLKLNENTATLLLGEWEFEDDNEDHDLTDSDPSASEDEDETSSKKKPTKKSSRKESKPQDKRLTVDIDLALSGWSNAREYYDQKKTAAAKEGKTLLASTKALKSAQQKIEADLKRALKQEKQVLRPVRKQMWFEKFIYFISSDGYLVIGGKDVQQSEIIYKRYLKKGDVYIHADLNGAASVIVKNNINTPDAPIPPSTLSQAGNLSVATSSAWDSKAVMSAWWVPAEQVSKIASTGDYLNPGSFHIRGDKNYLPPAQLLLGFAVLWQISDASKAKHMKHRVGYEEQHKGADQEEAITSTGNDSESETKKDNNLVDGGSDDGHESDVASDTTDDEEEEPVRDYKNPLQAAPTAESTNDDEEPEAEEAEAKSNAQGHSVDDQSLDEVREEGEIHSTNPKEIVEERATTPTESVELDDSENSDVEVASTTQKSTASKTPLPVRGKRGKRKKIAAKYADQDEEDRQLAMQLLGSKAGQENAAAEAQAKKAKEEEAALQKTRRREQHLKAQKEGKQLEDERKLAQEEAAEADEEDEPAGSIDLDALVGTPMAGDEILEAIPVCAPWAALGRYKYKVKLQPGSQKKGKAIREILGAWAHAGANKKNVDEKSEDVERIWPREVELIRLWKDTEVFNVLPVGKVRVMMSAGASGGKEMKAGGKGKPRGGKGGKKR